jgi:hypothetical protein
MAGRWRRPLKLAALLLGLVADYTAGLVFALRGRFRRELSGEPGNGEPRYACAFAGFDHHWYLTILRGFLDYWAEWSNDTIPVGRKPQTAQKGAIA